jgi:hypothetical protein
VRSLITGVAKIVAAFVLMGTSGHELSAADEQVLRPSPLPAGVEVGNPLRGLYTWLDLHTAPTPEPSLDRYKRFPWAQLEPEQGHYDFGAIENELSKLPKGTKFGFRVMALNSTWSWKDGSDVPSYIMAKCPGGFFVPVEPKGPRTPAHLYIPDWNDEFFLQRVDRLLAALGQKYDGDPRIAWVDIGIYGNWGEWHVFGLADYWRGAIPYDDARLNPRRSGPGTPESQKRIVDAHANAFKKTRLLMMTADNGLLPYALRLPLPIPIGLRRDSFGAYHFARDFLPSETPKADRDLVLDRWKSAPFVVESFGPPKAFEVGPAGLVQDVQTYHIAAIGNGGIGDWDKLSREEQEGFLGAGRRAGYRLRIVAVALSPTVIRGRQVSLRTQWENSGVTPTYDPWKVRFVLRDVHKVEAAATVTSKVDLQNLLPTKEPALVEDVFTLTANVAAGKYELRVKISDPRSYDDPLRLAMQGRNSDGSYTLGTVQVY